MPAAVGVGLGLRQLRRRTEEEPAFKSMVGLMGAAVFAISLMPIPVPVAGSVSHPAGTPLAAIVVGPFVGVLLASISLLVQALFFAHGGLTTLGANIVSEGIAGSLVGFGVFWAARRSGRSLLVAGFLAGFLGDLAVYLTTAVELGLALFPAREAGREIFALFLAFMPTQLPLAIVEGVLTGGVLSALAEVRPDIAERLGLLRDSDRFGALGGVGGAPGVAAAGGVSGGIPGAAHGPGPVDARLHRAPRRHQARRWWSTAGHPARALVVAAGLLVIGLAVWGLVWAVAISAGDWVGIDAGIMEATAAEQGREAWTPFINTDVGDLLVLVFFVGAAIAGGVIGWLVRGLRTGTAAPPAATPAGNLEAIGSTIPTVRKKRRWGRLVWAALVGLLAVLVLWAWFGPSLALGPLTGESIRSIGNAILDPTGGQVLTARGGDAVLFAGMVLGLVLGTAIGWSARGRGRLRPRLPHFHLHDLRGGDQLTWDTRGLGRVDARVKIAVISVLLVVNLVGGWAVSLALLVASLLVLLVVQRMRPWIVGVRMMPALIVALMLLLLRGLTVPGRALVGIDLPGLARVDLTVEGLQAGAELGVVVLAGVSLMLVLGLTTPLPALLSAFRWYRVPAAVVDVGMLMYRYVFLFAEEAGRMRQAQRLRGPDVPTRRAVGGFSHLGANLLSRSYDRSLRVYEAQRMRGGGAERLVPQPRVQAMPADTTRGGRKRGP